MKSAGLWPVCPSVRPSLRPSATVTTEPGSFAPGGGEGSPPWTQWLLSADADGQTVPLSASPRVAVILRVGVSVRVTAVSHGGVVG